MFGKLRQVLAFYLNKKTWVFYCLKYACVPLIGSHLAATVVCESSRHGAFFILCCWLKKKKLYEVVLYCEQNDMRI